MHFLTQFSAITGILQHQLGAVVFQDCQYTQPKSKDKGKLHVIKFKSKIDAGLQVVFCKKKKWEILNQLILRAVG